MTLTNSVLVQHAGVCQGRISSDKCTSCHTEIEAAGQAFSLTQSHYTDTGPASSSADPIPLGRLWYDWTWRNTHGGKRDSSPGLLLLTGTSNHYGDQAVVNKERPGAGIMEADDHQVTTVFTVQPSFHHRHSTNRVSGSVTIVGERRGEV